MNDPKLTDFTPKQLSLYAELMHYCKSELKTITPSEKYDVDLLIIQLLNAKLLLQEQEKISMN